MMIRRFARWLVRLAAVAFEQFEHELKQARQRRYMAANSSFEAPRLLSTTDSPAMDMVNEFVLRDSLRRALRRYSPSEQTPEA